MSIDQALNNSDVREHEELKRARREGYEAESSLQLALERAELAEAAERAAQINVWASGALFGSPGRQQQ